MGRLRDDFENPLFQGVAEEVVDLFGVDDAVLMRHAVEDQQSVTDVLWDEPSTVAKFRDYPIKCQFDEYEDSESASDEGFEENVDARVYFSMNHLTKAGVVPDHFGDYVTPGDAVRLHIRGQWIEYDIISADKDGWINDSDKFTGYSCGVARRSKYVPERKTHAV